MIRGMFDYGALPSLERLAQFTEARQGVLSHNIANVSTPHFRPADVSVDDFRRKLGQAMDERRRRPNPVRGPLELRDSREVEFRDPGITLRPSPTDRNVMFHDRNNRDLERMMQDLVENAMAHNASVELLRNQFDMLKTAIRERVV